MNQHEPTPERQPRHAKDTRLDELLLTTEDPLLRARWQEGLTRWGSAFVAYTKLGDPRLRHHDVLVAFQDCYIASFPDLQACLQEQLDALGWTTQRKKLIDADAIPEDVLVWDFAAMAAHVREAFDVVHEGGEVHLFSR